MAFSDWDIVNSEGIIINSAVLNSSITPNPLTTGGSYCRRIATQSFGDGASFMFALKTTFAGGAFYGIPNSKAIRIQANLRVTSLGNANSLNGIFIHAKSTVFGKNTGTKSCYALGIKSFGAGNGVYSKCLFLNNATAVNLGSASSDTWYSFRMEVYPVGTAADVVKCFEETSPGNWTELTSLTIPNTSPNYISWDATRRTGFFIFNETNYSGNSDGYIDNYSASVANAPIPIP